MIYSSTTPYSQNPEMEPKRPSLEAMLVEHIGEVDMSVSSLEMLQRMAAAASKPEKQLPVVPRTPDLQQLIDEREQRQGELDIADLRELIKNLGEGQA